MKIYTTILSITALLALSACTEQDTKTKTQVNTETTVTKIQTPKLSSTQIEEKTVERAEKVRQQVDFSPHADIEYPTKLLFGEQHIHSALSADAGGGGTKLLPRDLYRFAKGGQVMSNTNQPVKRDRPLDFMCITEHTDGMGAITDILKGSANIMADEQGKSFHDKFAKGGKTAKLASQELIQKFSQGTLSPVLNYQPGNEGYKRTWQDLVDAAEENNEPHKFTAMIAYEWTSLVKGNNLHRNVIFRDGPERTYNILPFTMTPPMGSPNPEDLWQWLQTYEDTTGGQVIAIPHNGDLSNGMLFNTQDDFKNGASFDANYLKTRAKWEKLYEIMQSKGDTETHAKLSPKDEFADYETFDYGNLDATQKKTDKMLEYEYARSSLKNGLKLKDEFGINPFKFGFVAGSDHHTGLASEMDDNYFGAFTWMEPNKNRILGKDGKLTKAKYNKKLDIGFETWQYSSPGLTAVWAQTNTRASIFDSMKRKEVYATTGPRIRLRVFAGFDFTKEDLKNRNLADVGYAKGVSMGGDLYKNKKNKNPTFIIAALRDADGANLDRVQLIKGWIDKKGNTHEKVINVAWSGDRKLTKEGKLPAVGDTVDLSVPTWTNTIGAATLYAYYEDKDFDASKQAFYYVRVLEIPTPRWPAYDAVRYNLDLPKSVKVKTQERAYSSPIWYNPK
ncbi:hypothetical protein MNB_SM-4-343 [hydrothermal vent metagenome]|uniref:DUF3604 domain-containing protein n=1 Tax=hydrothermal vent metagenome TaxID=652676 RepID=A0A1W1BLB1_9ZZZZ